MLKKLLADLRAGEKGKEIWKGKIKEYMEKYGTIQPAGAYPGKKIKENKNEIT